MQGTVLLCTALVIDYFWVERVLKVLKILL